MSEVPSGEGPRDLGPGWTRILLVAFVATVALRFAAIEMDPPYGIIRTVGEFLTDEGWYTKAAQLHARFGDWESVHDPVWISHNALASLSFSAAFELFGVSLVAARMVSLVSFVLTAGAFYAVIRTSQPRGIAFATSFLASVTLETVAYSRLALLEPLGTAVSMLALAAWVRLPRGFAACVVGLALAAASYFVKASFLYTFAALATLSLGEAVLLFRERRRFEAVAIVAAGGAIVAGMFAVQEAIARMVPAQAQLFRDWHINSRKDGLNVLSILEHEARMVFKLTFWAGVTVLVLTTAAAGARFVARFRDRLRPPWDRGTVALAIWGAGGVAFLGLFREMPVRYLYFCSFPLAFAAVELVRRVVPAHRRELAVLGVVAAHLAAQLPGYWEWLTRPALFTAADAARDAASRMELDDRPGGVTVAGHISSFVSLMDDRIRPIEEMWDDWPEQRMRRWRPKYLFTFPAGVEGMMKACPDIVAGVEPLGTWTIMERYGTGKDWTLYRIVYKP